MHELEALEEWIRALIDEKISDSFGRNSLTESIITSELHKDLIKALKIQ